MPAKSFCEKFGKYDFTEHEREITDKILDFSAKVDVDKRMIMVKVKADIDGYVHFCELEKIERHIGEAYELSYMEIYPSFKNVKFNLGYMDHVFYELARLTALGKGFFNGAEASLEGAEISAEGNVMSISLKKGRSYSLPESATS